MNPPCAPLFVMRRLVQQGNGPWSGTLPNALTSASSPAKATCGVLASPCGRPSPTEANPTRYQASGGHYTPAQLLRAAALFNSLVLSRKWKDQRWTNSSRPGTAWSVQRPVQRGCTRWWRSVGRTSKTRLFRFHSSHVWQSGSCSVTSPLFHQARGSSRLQEGRGVHEVLLQFHI